MLPSSDESSATSPPMIHHFKGSIRSNTSSDPMKALLANGYSFRLQNFASEFEALLSRHLSEQESEE